MAYDFLPKKKEAGDFRLGSFAWTTLIETAFGCLFPCLTKGGRYIYGWETDKRFKKEHEYPILISNSRMRVTATEAKLMARMARNLVSIQRTLDDSHYNTEVAFDAAEWEKKWPQKLRDDWVDEYEKFADWAEKSGGFKIG
ncbi:hypothetical protein [Paenibacillus sp. 7516]|uniref:hypothetical protein n=1 Tax=Paenibacillus sp. 7516 TaxID=2022549 RepID=UPI000BA571E6|nr:hypothetical protein [Paenibacillus sp. 7516]PAF31889.1 hypothetical protein CHI14_09560 [Paenibacillus sp. 7516]